jgi:hypothetical protein
MVGMTVSSGTSAGSVTSTDQAWASWSHQVIEFTLRRQQPFEAFYTTLYPAACTLENLFEHA